MIEHTFSNNLKNLLINTLFSDIFNLKSTLKKTKSIILESNY
jgi:hypothetical protein